MAEQRKCPCCGEDQWKDESANSWYCLECGSEAFQVTHKGVVFTQDHNHPSRLNFAGNSVDVPGSGITDLKAYKGAIIIECKDAKFQLTFFDVKDWMLLDISPQTATYQKREEAESGPVRRKK